ncbi:MAG: Flp pilus assembly complex ATPase component TadA [Planctomycetes bacterium]|nr:Flp pilus assembly complex ATPase component TadA [Planctomycetota bacterium]
MAKSNDPVDLDAWLQRQAAAAAASRGKPTGESLSELWSPETDGNALTRRGVDAGQALLEIGAIDAAQLSSARTVAVQTPGKSIADILFDMGVDEPSLQKVVADAAGLSFERIENAEGIELRYLQRLGTEFCTSHGVLPLRMSGSRLLLGVTHPDNLMIIDEVRHKLGVVVKPVVICREDIASVVATQREEEGSTQEVDQIIAGIEEDDVEVVQTKDEEVDLEKMAGESPVIRYVNYLIFNAVKEGASDIHIEPQEKKLKVRYRVDGVLFEMMNPPHHMHAAIISRLKIMANLDISERRLPQDGRVRAMVHGRKLDLRLSTLPTAQGEKAVMRILDTRSIQVTLDQLGMDPDALLMWKHQIDQPHGIILVTGPTGSGKTTTLYSSIAQMDVRTLNISTVEDPVEYHLNGISQVQVHEKIGMSFSLALRALLRQDPDVIMVGEIRDAETARIAIQASLTGHLVLSTLHTNDAPSSITRLINIGVEPYLIGAALNATLAQRLVRKLCTHCKVQHTPTDATIEHLAMHGINLQQVWGPKGCDRCRNTGYSGRVGLYELLLLDDMLRDKIASNPSVTDLRRVCVERGMVTLREDGFKKVGQGITTVEEVLRVTESTI